VEIPPTVPPNVYFLGRVPMLERSYGRGLWWPRNGRFRAEQRLPRSDRSSVSALIKKLQLMPQS